MHYKKKEGGQEGGRESEKEEIRGRMTDGPKEKRAAGFSTAAERSI